MTTALCGPPPRQEALVQGQLGEKLVPDLIREIAQKNASGLLRLSSGKVIKAIFFESGAPTFAISNLSNEQLDAKLVNEGLATPEQIDHAKERAGKPHRLGPALVEIGVLEDGQMRTLVCGQVMEIILSVFEWMQADYSFDERIRAAHEVTLGISSTDVLLEGARHAAEVPEMAEALVANEAVVLRPKSSSSRTESGSLMPLESYILSRIESPTPVSEVGALTGLGDADAHRAVCVLVAAGFLKVLDQDKGEDDDPVAREADESLERVREDVTRLLHYCTAADYYEVLGCTRQATTAEIKTAYYQLAKKYHPDRYHQRDTGDLRNKLETLFASITQAYDTLSQPSLRAGYDDRIRKGTGPLATTVPGPTPMSEPVKPRASDEEHSKATDSSSSNGHGNHDASARSADAPGAETISAANMGSPQLPPAQRAEHYYQQGRARFERKEYHAAVHLLREAIKLDSSRAAYHYHLGIALIRNPRTRRDAEIHLARAAELEPYNAQIRLKLGLLYKEAGLSKKAENFFREALQLDPDNRMAKRELAGGDAKTKSANGGGSIWKSDVGTIAKKLFKK